MIKINDLSKIYKINEKKSSNALNCVNLEVKRGEFVIILGKSGSGKSTLLNLLGGLDTKTSGDIYINGINTDDFTEDNWNQYRNQRVGFVFQGFNLINHLTALDNVEMSLKVAGLGKQDRRERAEYLLKQVGLEEQMDKKPGTLSGGQQQRIAIARALANDPDIILADEPTGALDVETSKEIMDLLKEVSKDKIVILVTHDKEVVSKYGTRVIEIKNGKVINNTIGKEVVQKIQEKKYSTKKVGLPFYDVVKFSFGILKRTKKRFLYAALGFSIGIITLLLILGLGEGILHYSVEKAHKENNIDILSYTYKGRANRSIQVEWLEKVEEIDNAEIVIPEGNLNYITVIISNLENVSRIKNYSIPLESNSKYIRDNELIVGDIPSEESEVLVNKYVVFDLLGLTGVDILNMTDENLIDIFNSSIKDINFNISITWEDKEVKIVGIYSGEFQVLFNRDFFHNYIKRDQAMESFTVKLKKYDRNSIVKTNNKIVKLFKEHNFSLEEINTLWVIEEIYQLVVSIVSILSIFGFIVLFGGAITISIIINMSVMEQTRNIGILRSIGVNKKDIRRIFISNGVFIGILGSLIGFVFTYILTLLINLYVSNELEVLFDMKGIDFNIFLIRLWMIVPLILIGILFGLIGARKPSIQATKVSPIEALRVGMMN